MQIPGSRPDKVQQPSSFAMYGLRPQGNIHPSQIIKFCRWHLHIKHLLKFIWALKCLQCGMVAVSSAASKKASAKLSASWSTQTRTWRSCWTLQDPTKVATTEQQSSSCKSSCRQPGTIPCCRSWLLDRPRLLGQRTAARSLHPCVHQPDLTH